MPGEAPRERSKIPSEGEAAEDALALARQLPQEGLHPVGLRAAQHPVAVVKDDRADIRDGYRPVVEGAEPVGGHEEEIGALGKVPGRSECRRAGAGGLT